MRDTIFLYIVAILAFGFGLINFIPYWLKRNQTAQVVGTIISIKTPNPQNSKFRNSKWATLSYKVNGKNYQSQNRIQVPIRPLFLLHQERPIRTAQQARSAGDHLKAIPRRLLSGVVHD